MFVFVTCLWHPDRARDYNQVELLLKDTLRSVSSQTVKDFAIVVVGHRPPPYPLADNIHFVEVDFGAPAMATGGVVPRDQFREDKGRKIAVGVSYALNELGADYIGIFDADDFVSSRLVEEVYKQDGSSSYYISHGYVYSRASNKVAFIDNFHKRCGTSLIFRAADVKNVPYEGGPLRIAELTGREYYREVYGSHMNCFDRFASSDNPMRRLPLAGAMYVVDTGVNHSDNSMSEMKWKFIEPSDTLLSEFGLVGVPRAS